MYDSNASISVWVGNLGKYNEGDLVGEWFSLPRDDFGEDWQALMERIGIGAPRYGDPSCGVYEEVFCADWECRIPGLKYSEYPDYERLNEIAEEWDSLDGYEQDAIGVRMSLLGEDYETAARYSDQVHVYDGCHDMTAVAREVVSETGLLEEIPDRLQCYFDYEAYGRDLEIEGTFGYSEELGCMVEAY